MRHNIADRLLMKRNADVRPAPFEGYWEREMYKLCVAEILGPRGGQVAPDCNGCAVFTFSDGSTFTSHHPREI